MEARRAIPAFSSSDSCAHIAKKRAGPVQAPREFRGLQVVAAERVGDAGQLFQLAQETYAALRARIPTLPAFDARDRTGAKVVVCSLDVVAGEKQEHVDRGLFNIVTGDAASIGRLQLAGGIGNPLAAISFPSGAALVIPGYSAHLLDSTIAAPAHSASLQPGEQLLVLAVRLTCEEVRLPGGGSIRLQAMLESAFAQGPMQAAAPQAPTQVPLSPEPNEPMVVTLCSMLGHKVVCKIRRDTKVARVLEAYCARRSISLDIVRLVADGRGLQPHMTFLEQHVQDGSLVSVIVTVRGD